MAASGVALGGGANAEKTGAFGLGAPGGVPKPNVADEEATSVEVGAAAHTLCGVAGGGTLIRNNWSRNLNAESGSCEPTEGSLTS